MSPFFMIRTSTRQLDEVYGSRDVLREAMSLQPVWSEDEQERNACAFSEALAGLALPTRPSHVEEYHRPLFEDESAE